MTERLEDAVSRKADVLRQMLISKVEDNLSGALVASRTGNLKASIVSDLSMTAGVVTASIGSVGVPYAAILESGGSTPPHDIVSVKAKALLLAGAAGGRFARRVHHPGAQIAPRYYLGGALAALRSDIVAGLKDAVTASLGVPLSEEGA